MVNEKKVYIIIVNYKNYKDTIECLESVLKINYTNFQVLVVDNSCNDESKINFDLWRSGKLNNVPTSFEEIVYPLIEKPISWKSTDEDTISGKREIFSEKIVYIKANENRGFAAANNVALNYISQVGEYSFAWLLNNDTIVKSDSLLNLVCHSEKKPSEGIIGAKQILYSYPDQVQSIGGEYNKWFGIVSAIGSKDPVDKIFNMELTKLDYVEGASMFVKKNMIEDVGLMYEDYFIYFEELDWAIRAKRAGWDLGICQECHVFHKGASTTTTIDGVSKIADFYYARNRILITRKYFPYALFSLYIGFIKYAYNRVKLGKFDRVKMLINILNNPSEKFIK